MLTADSSISFVQSCTLLVQPRAHHYLSFANPLHCIMFVLSCYTVYLYAYWWFPLTWCLSSYSRRKPSSYWACPSPAPKTQAQKTVIRILISWLILFISRVNITMELYQRWQEYQHADLPFSFFSWLLDDIVHNLCEEGTM